MSHNIDISRNSIMINEKLNYKRRIDLESEETCNIWIEVIIDRKKVLILGGYRTWSALKIQNIPNSRSIKNQLKRFKITLHNWEKAMGEDKEVII